MSDIVTYAVQGHLGVITLNNPPVNALSVSKGVLQRILPFLASMHVPAAPTSRSSASPRRWAWPLCRCWPLTWTR